MIEYKLHILGNNMFRKIYKGFEGTEEQMILIKQGGICLFTNATNLSTKISPVVMDGAYIEERIWRGREREREREREKG
jgi:hypothetical protein